MKFDRYSHTATLLADGTVLVAGGISSNGTLNQAEIYDPVAATFSQVGNMNVARFGHTATLLPDGTVLIVGGDTQKSNGGNIINQTAEIYSPSTQTFTSAQGQMNLARDEGSFTATLLNNGEVLIAGGLVMNTGSNVAELYNPSSQTFTVLTAVMSSPRNGPSATLLDNGKVLIAGGTSGDNSNSTLATAELFDPSSNTFTATGSMTTPRWRQMASFVPSINKVLVAGGVSTNGFLKTAELFDPTSGSNGAFSLTGTMANKRECSGIGSTQ
jgi:hypothetical protein